MKGPGDFTPVYDSRLDDDEIWDEDDWQDHYGGYDDWDDDYENDDYDD